MSPYLRAGYGHEDEPLLACGVRTPRTKQQFMTDSDVTLRVQDVTKRFGDFTAVDGLSFDVRRGRVFGFLGPNGAGKTTTIRMIVGITAPDEGKISSDFL